MEKSVLLELKNKFENTLGYREKARMMDEIITFINEVHMESIEEIKAIKYLNESSIMSSGDRVLELTTNLSLEMKEVFRFANISNKVHKIKELEDENSNLKDKISKAQDAINLAKADGKLEVKSSKNKLNKNLQIVRDKLIGTVETTINTGKLLNNEGITSKVESSLNNVIYSVEAMAEEMSALGLWNEDESKPKTDTLILTIPKEEVKEEVKGKAKKSTKKKSKIEREKETISNIKENGEKETPIEQIINKESEDKIKKIYL